MKDIKILIRENIPCWYELSWRKTKPAVILRIHKDFIKNIESIPKKNRWADGLREEFKFTSFTDSLNGNFGFDNAFIRKGETEEFVEFVVGIPKIRQKTGNPCPNCKGSGKDHFLERECSWCRGTKMEHKDDWRPVYAISASFTVFSQLSFFSEKETSSSLIQLMTIQSLTRRGMHGGSISGHFSVPLCNWMDSLRERGESRIIEMVEAMQIVYKRMWGGFPFSRKYDFRASVDYEGGWLNTSCPGNACGLNPKHMGPKKGSGYEFSSHNVDTPAQQLEIIASLAALHDKARREIKI